MLTKFFIFFNVQVGKNINLTKDVLYCKMVFAVSFDTKKGEKMFYIIFSVLFAIFVATFCVLKFVVFKNGEKFEQASQKVLKIASIVYCSLMLVSILLPDRFSLSFSSEELASSDIDKGYAIIRWFSLVNFVVLPLAVFFKNRTIKNIAIYFCIPVSIASIFFYENYMVDFTSTVGRGLNSISVLSQSFKNFLINPIFRSIWFGLILMLQLLIPIVLAIKEKHIFDFKNSKEYAYFFLILPFVILSIVPIYVPQHLFGYSNMIFEAYSLVHIFWFLSIIAEIAILYFLFRKKDNQTKMLLLFVLALSLVMQYNQMFSAISINAKRFPFQLCNIGSYLVLISLLTKNKKLFNFTVIINVVGVIFALAMPDLDGRGLFYLYNMHFIFEHGNVLIVPVLALMFGIFPRLDKHSLIDCLIGFTIYFASAWILGTTFNAIAKATGNNFYEANYLFMFLPDVAIELLPFTKALFDINFSVGYATIYPVLQILIYIVFVSVCTLLFFAIQLVYKIKDLIKSNKNLTKQNQADIQSDTQNANIEQ